MTDVFIIFKTKDSLDKEEYMPVSIICVPVANIKILKD